MPQPKANPKFPCPNVSPGSTGEHHPFFSGVLVEVSELPKLIIYKLIGIGLRTAHSFAPTCHFLRGFALISLRKQQQVLINPVRVSVQHPGPKNSASDPSPVVATSSFSLTHWHQVLQIASGINPLGRDPSRNDRARLLPSIDTWTTSRRRSKRCQRSPTPARSSPGVLFPELESLYWNANEVYTAPALFSLSLSPYLKRVTLHTESTSPDVPSGQLAAIDRIIPFLPRPPLTIECIQGIRKQRHLLFVDAGRRWEILIPVYLCLGHSPLYFPIRVTGGLPDGLLGSVSRFSFRPSSGTTSTDQWPSRNFSIRLRGTVVDSSLLFYIANSLRYGALLVSTGSRIFHLTDGHKPRRCARRPGKPRHSGSRTVIASLMSICTSRLDHATLKAHSNAPTIAGDM